MTRLSLSYDFIVFDWEGTLFDSAGSGRNGIGLFEGVLSMLHALKQQHYKLAIATGKSRAGLNEVLAHGPLALLFDSSRTADETQNKPHPQMLFELMEELGVAPQKTLMVGDSIYDLQMASHAGCDAVAVSYGLHDAQAFDRFSPRHIAHSIQDLREYLGA